MKTLFTKPIFPYVIGILLLIISTGIVLSQVIENYIVLIAVLLIEYIILMLLLLSIFDKYIKPIKKVTKTVDKIVKGNYRARIHHTGNSNVGELTHKINTLARNLSELSMNEQMQSEQLSTVFDNTESGLVLIDEKGYIHLVNRKFVSMFGKSQKEYKGYLYYDVLDNEIIHQTVQKTFLYEKNVKEAFTHFEGVDKYYLEIVGAPIFNERNMLKGAVLVLYDITELKKLELMRKDFVANVSHELKTPITSIKGFSETLLDGSMSDEIAIREFLGIIYNESHRLQLLIEDLLTLSRLEKEDFHLILTEVDMSSLVSELKPVIVHKAEQRKLELSIHVDENSILMADSERVKQIFINLLDNAINYTPEKGKISLVVSTAGDFIEIMVKDSGIGIEQEALSRIFERFYRVDKARSRNTGGTGLGLAIVKHIVEVHEGDIKIESEVNQGTTVYVYLPKQKQD
ncbi:ATP-binding protein [Virgibacillus sp. C22-A2]|uniref:histidine kinase n=1 Tax=Virgibacillus tibetensis TaxID=3042313 RepID=A0ABU6K9E6_9BACI|nr:ATP-binding protein [Virgibacillus sp. C22-A2]